MAPLSLEQVLARSMRLPRQRARHQVSALFSATQSGDVTYRSHPPPPPPSTPGRRPVAPSTRHHAQRLSFFQLMEAQDAQRSAGRLQIHKSTSDSLVKNGSDLQSFLVTAQRMGDWQDALQAFLKATEVTLEADPEDSGRVRLARAPPTTVSSSSPSPSLQSSSASSQRALAPVSAKDSPVPVNPSEAHVRTVVEACAEGEQWGLVAALCQFYGPAFPAVITQAVTCVVNAAPRTSPETKEPAAVPTSRWQRGLHFLTQDIALSPVQIPVDAFNVCVAACEAEKDWQGALAVVRQMGPNPLQTTVLDGESTTTTTTTRATPPLETTEAVPAHGPAPNVVTYATLIATLEQAGKSGLVPQVLNRLPPVEKEEITASYAALIYVWSNQLYGKQNRRFE